MDTFTFDSMTPELQNYLDHQNTYQAQADSTYPAVTAARKAWEGAGKPEGGPLKAAVQEQEEVHYSGLRAHREESMRLKDLIQNGLLHTYGTARKRWMCRDATRSGEPKDSLSPSGKYKLTVTSHKTGEGTWNYTKGVVSKLENGAWVVISEIYRNYSSFHFAWVEAHPNGHDYLVM